MARVSTIIPPYYPSEDRGNIFVKFFGEFWDYGNGRTEYRFKYSAGSGKGVLVVAFTPEPDRQIIVIDELQPNNRNIRSCIGCGVKKGEPLDTAAERGLRQKAGYVAVGRLDPLVTFTKDIGYTYDSMTIYLATDCERFGDEVPGVTLMDPRQYAREFMNTVTLNPLDPMDGLFTQTGLTHASDRLQLGLFR